MNSEEITKSKADTKHDYPDNPYLDPMETFDEQKIMALFKWLEFKDPIGHPLEKCLYFLELVQLALRKNNATDDKGSSAT